MKDIIETTKDALLLAILAGVLLIIATVALYTLSLLISVLT